MATPAASPSVITSRRASSPAWARRGTSAGPASVSTRSVTSAMATPRPAAHTAMSAFSITNWRVSLGTVAPSARRMATSRRRRVPRTSTMLATFAHASSSTSATAIASTRSVGRTGPKTTDMNGSTCAPRALFSGYACSSASVVAVISFCAEAIAGARRHPAENENRMRAARHRRRVQLQRHPGVHAGASVAIGKPAAVVGRQQPLQHADIGSVGKHADDDRRAGRRGAACGRSRPDRAGTRAPTAAR